MTADDSLLEAGDEPVVRLVRWTGPWPDDDPDHNFKSDVAAYANADPLSTIANLAANLDVPVGAVVRYVLAKWASGGSEGVLELGPSTVDRLTEVVREARSNGSEAARLAAFEQLAQMIEWVRLPLDDPSVTPDGGGEPPSR